MKKNIISIFSVWTLFACVNQSAGYSLADKADFETILSFENSGLQITLKNLSEHKLCLPVSDWPDAKGWVGDVSLLPYIHYKGKKFKYEKRWSAMGHSNNMIVLSSGEAQQGTFKYTEFENGTEDLKFGEIEYVPVALYCK